MLHIYIYQTLVLLMFCVVFSDIMSYQNGTYMSMMCQQMTSLLLVPIDLNDQSWDLITFQNGNGKTLLELQLLY